MPVPSPRNKILPARGNYADLLANVASLLEGEMCYAIDQDGYYQKEGGVLVQVGGGAWTEGTNQLYPADAGNDVLIGGTLPSAPNITLANSGAITALADATINTLTVGLGSGSVANNTAVGKSALQLNTTGDNNTAIGRSALLKNTEGNSNTAVGISALNENTAGNNGTAIGRDSQRYANDTTTAFNNTNVSVGYSSLRGSTTPANNTGLANTAVGYEAMLNNTIGDENTAVGRSALQNNTEGNYNTALSKAALQSNTTGASNTAVGRNGLFSNTTGNENTALGLNALYSNTEGDYNSAVGRQALFNNTTGEYNTALGRNAGYYIEGSSNTILGAYEGTAADSTLSDTVIISAGATERMRIDSNGRLLVGTSGNFNSDLVQIQQNSGNCLSLRRNTNAQLAPTNILLTRSRSTESGFAALANNDWIGQITFRGADGTTDISSASISAQVDGTPGANDMPGRLVFSTTADGASSPTERMRIDSTGDLLIGGTLPSAPNITLASGGAITALADATINTLTVGLGGGSVANNTAVGLNALNANTTGDSNTALGVNTLYSNTEGSQNAALGGAALFSNTIGEYNTAVGRNALYNNTEGTANTAVGRTALLNNTTGLQSTAVGQSTLFSNITGNNNSAVGREALYSNAAGSQNAALGFRSGYYIEGSNNTILGAYQGTSADATLNNTVIISAGVTERARCHSTGIWNLGTSAPVYADNAAAKTGGLVDGDVYRKSDGTLMIVFT